MACDRCNDTGHCPECGGGGVCPECAAIASGEKAAPLERPGVLMVQCCCICDGTHKCPKCGGDGKCPKCHGHPHWTRVECEDCSGGSDYGDGYAAGPCKTCGRAGEYWRHEPSGVLAMYPGGPFLGREMA